MKLHAALIGAINEGLMPRFRTKIEDLLPKIPAKASGEQIAAMLRNNGVSDHEIKWTKLEGLLKQPKVTKDEIINHLADHGLPFKTLDHAEEHGHKYQAYALKGGKNYGEKIFQLQPSERKPWKLEWDDVKPEYSDVDTQFNGHKPGADRSGRYNAPDLPLAEVLSKTNKDNTHHISSRVRDENYYGQGGNRYESRSKWVTVYSATCSSDEQKLRCIEAAKEACGQKLADMDARDNSDSQDYKSGHWDGSNQLFHVRHQEFTDADGKKLWLIEEIQSDWHQQGRKKGYKDGKQKYQILFDNRPLPVDQDSGNEFASQEEAAAYVKSSIPPSMHGKITYRPYGGGEIPDAPMKKSWEEMAFKWAVHQAVEANAERIGWVTGDIAADRFDISKEVGRIDFIAREHRTKSSGDMSKDFLCVWDKHESKLPGFPKEVSGDEEVESIIGKEATAKLKAAPLTGYPPHIHRLEGVDLKLGGEGMKSAYDQRIVSIAKKIAKITGAMVGKVKLKGSESGDEGNEMDTPVYPSPTEVANMPTAERMFVHGEPEDDGKFYVTDYDGNKISDGFDSEEEAHDERDNLFGYRQAEKTGKASHEVWYMDLNEKTKAMVEGGMRATFESVKPKTAKPWWVV